MAIECYFRYWHECLSGCLVFYVPRFLIAHVSPTILVYVDGFDLHVGPSASWNTNPTINQRIVWNSWRALAPKLSSVTYHFFACNQTTTLTLVRTPSAVPKPFLLPWFPLSLLYILWLFPALFWLFPFRSLFHKRICKSANSQEHLAHPSMRFWAVNVQW